MKIRIILGMVAVLSVAQTVFADSTETLIPIDQNNSIFVFTQEMEQKGKVFTEYVNFLSATLYQLADGTFMLQVAYKADNTTMQRRQPMTPEEVQRLRQRVTSSILLVTQLTKITPRRSGREMAFSDNLHLNGRLLCLGVDVYYL